MAEECPVCLESLEGTIVTLGCCKNRLHVQCYVSPCPLCRAQVPPLRQEHVVVHVPVPVAVTRPQRYSSWAPFVGAALILFLFATSTNVSGNC